MIEVRTETLPFRNPGALTTIYSVFVDGQLWCTTENDDDGFRLMVAKAMVEGKKLVAKYKESELD